MLSINTVLTALILFSEFRSALVHPLGLSISSFLLFLVSLLSYFSIFRASQLPGIFYIKFATSLAHLLMLQAFPWAADALQSATCIPYRPVCGYPDLLRALNDSLLFLFADLTTFPYCCPFDCQFTGPSVGPCVDGLHNISCDICYLR